MEYFVRRAVISALSQYIETDFDLVLNLFSSGNTVSLENVRLKKSAIPSSFPVKVIQGILGRVVISLPLFKLSNTPTRVYVDDVSIVLELKEENDVSRDDLVSRLKKRKHDARRKIEALFTGGTGLRQEQEDESSKKSSENGLPSLPGFVRNLMKNVKLHIGNIHIRLEQKLERAGEINRCNAIGICIQSIDLDNLNEAWEPGVCDRLDKMFKLLRINRFGCYVDSEGPRAEIIEFSKLRENGDVVQVPSPLVTYKPHVWLLEPLTISVRLSLESWWPKKGEERFQPKVSMSIVLSKVVINAHGTFAKTIRHMYQELNTWRTKLTVKVNKMDALNSSDTMSKQEHAERCEKYHNFYAYTVQMIQLDSVSKSKKRKLLKKLAILEEEIHLEDLVDIWGDVLDNASFSRPISSSISQVDGESLKSRSSQQRKAKSVSDQKSVASSFSRRTNRTSRKGFDAFSSQSSVTSAGTSTKRGNFVRMLTMAQISDGVDEYFDDMAFETLSGTSFEPLFDINLVVTGLETRISLSKFSDNMLTVEMESFGLSLQDHSVEDVKERRDSASPDMSAKIAFAKSPGCGVIAKIYEARGLCKGGSPYCVVRYNGVSHRSHHGTREKDPTWNEAIWFPDEDLEGQKHIKVEFEVWVSRDIGKDIHIASKVLSVNCKVLEQTGTVHVEWLNLGHETGSLLVSVEIFHREFPRLTRSLNRIPASVKDWGDYPSMWLDLYLGSFVVKTSCTLETRTDKTSSFSSMNTGNKVRVHHIDLLKLERGTYILLIVERIALWNRLMGVNTLDQERGDEEELLHQDSFLDKDIPFISAKTMEEVDGEDDDDDDSAQSDEEQKRPGLRFHVDVSDNEEDDASGGADSNYQSQRTRRALIRTHVIVNIPEIFLLFSKWQIMFVMTQMKKIYVIESDPNFGVDGSMKMGSSTHLLESMEELEESKAEQLFKISEELRKDTLNGDEDLQNFGGSSFSLGGGGKKSKKLAMSKYFTIMEEESNIFPFVVVAPDTLPIVLTCHIYLGYGKAGFTWGNGSVSTNETDHHLDVAYLVVNNAILLLASHKQTRDFRGFPVTGMYCNARIGSFGLVDASCPDRPVVTRNNFRNTDFELQGDDQLSPMIAARICIPYEWAYHWNIDDRWAVGIPAEVSSRMSIHIVVRELAVEMPALQYTIPPLLGGLMPLTKLIELPPLPSIGVQAFSLKVEVGVTLYLAEKLDSGPGARVFYFNTQLGISGEVEAEKSTEKLDVDIGVDFGVVRLSKTRNKERKKIGFLPTSSGSRLETDVEEEDDDDDVQSSGTHGENVLEEANVETSDTYWKINHRILTYTRIQLQWRYTPSFSGVGHVRVDFRMDPMRIYFWVQDMALLFAILVNFFNDFLILESLITEYLAFELPELLQKGFFSYEEVEEDENGPAPGRSKSPLAGNGPNLLDHGVSRRRASSSVSEMSQPDDGENKNKPVVLCNYFALQPIIQLPYAIPTVDSLTYELKERHIVVMVIIGRDDSPVLRLYVSGSVKWLSSSLEFGMAIEGHFWNMRKAGWEPLIEPWDVNGTLVLSSASQGLSGISIKGAGILADEILEMDISEDFIKSMVDLLLQGVRYIDSDGCGAARTFYPLIDEDKKHQHQYELWNFTGETIYFQSGDDCLHKVLKGKDPHALDARLDCEVEWDLDLQFEVLPNDGRTEIRFWENEESCFINSVPAAKFMEDMMVPPNNQNGMESDWIAATRKMQSEELRKRRYIRIKFEHYDKSFQSYLIRIDRVGDYTLRMGNGNMLRVSIGTRNGVVRMVKLLSTISVSNRTSRDVILTPICNNRSGKPLPLPILKTAFCPISMTDNHLDSHYLIRATDDPQDGFSMAETKGFESKKDPIDGAVGEEGMMDIILDSIPYAHETRVLRSGNMVCAVEYEFLTLESMAHCNFIEGVKETMTIHRIRNYRPNWTRGMGKYLHSGAENKRREVLKRERKKALRTVQIVLKPLFSIVNSLPVAILVSTVHQGLHRKESSNVKLVPPGGRFVCTDTETHAFQLKLPSEDTEWSLPIPLSDVAPRGVADYIERLNMDLYPRSVMKLVPSSRTAQRHKESLLGEFTDEIIARTKRSGQEKSKQPPRNGRSSSSSAASIPSPHSRSGGGLAQNPRTTKSHQSSDVPLGDRNATEFGDDESTYLDDDDLNEEDELAHLTREDTYDIDIARRLHPDTVRHAGFKHIISIRLIESTETEVIPPSRGVIDTSNHSYRRISLMMKQDVLATALQRVTYSPNMETVQLTWEETLNFSSFDPTLVQRHDIPKWIYIQYIYFAHTSSGPSRRTGFIAGAAKVDIARLLFDSYLTSFTKTTMERFYRIPIHKLDQEHKVLKDDIIGYVSFDVRALAYEPNLQKRGARRGELGLTTGRMEDPSNTMMGVEGGSSSNNNRTSPALFDVQSSFTESIMLRDVEPPTDTEEFEILSDSDSEARSDVSLLDMEDADMDEEMLREHGPEGLTRRLSRLRGQLKKTVHARIFTSPIQKRMEVGALAAAAASAAELQRISYVDTQLLGRDGKKLGDHDFWDSLVLRHDCRRPPTKLRMSVGHCDDTGFRVNVYADLWFVNESSVPAIIRNEKPYLSGLHIVDPKENVLLNFSSMEAQDHFDLVLRRHGHLTSNVVNGSTVFLAASTKKDVTQEGTQVTFKFKDTIGGRVMVNPSFFAISRERFTSPIPRTIVCRLGHSYYVSNRTDLVIELRPRGNLRRLGSQILLPGQQKAPWHYGCNEMQIRLRIGHQQHGSSNQQTEGVVLSHQEKEDFPISDWSGTIDLPLLGAANFNTIPIGLFDPDGVAVKALRIVIAKTIQSARASAIITFQEDTPATYLVNNQTTRTVIISQRESGGNDEFSTHELVLKPGVTIPFAWSRPSAKDRRMDVRMVLTPKDKSMLSRVIGRLRGIPDELSTSYHLDKVGKLKSISDPPIELHGNIEVVGSSRILVIQCEKTIDPASTTSRSRLRSRQPSSGGGSSRDGLPQTKSKKHLGQYPQSNFGISRDDIFEHQYVVVVRVLEARNIGVPRGVPKGAPRAVISCGHTSFTSPEGELIRNLGIHQQNGDLPGLHSNIPAVGAPVGTVKFLHQPYRFGFDITKPKRVKFELVQPLADGPDGVKNDTIGSVSIDIHDQFYESRDIARITPGWISLSKNTSTGNQFAEIRCEIYLLSNMTAGVNRKVPRMFRIRLAGFGLSILNGAKKREELYFRLRGVDIGIQSIQGKHTSFTMRIDWLQLDNVQPYVQNRICIIPVFKDVSFLEVYFVINDISMNTISIETFQCVLQSMVVKIDEKVLDAALRGMMAGLSNKDDLSDGLMKARQSVSGTFSGKRTIEYRFKEDIQSGETSVVVEATTDERDAEAVHIYFRHQVLQSQDTIREIDNMIRNYLNVYIRDFHIYPMKLTVSFFFQFANTELLSQYENKSVKPFKGFIAAFGKWSDVVIRVAAVHETDKFNNPINLAKEISLNYVIQLSKQAWKGVAALEILGNPQHLVERVLDSIVVFSTTPVQTFRSGGLEAGSKSTGDAIASLMCTSVAAPTEFTARITGSMATLLEGTRAVRHLGKPVRLLTNVLEAFQSGVEFFDPLHESYYPIRKGRTFDEDGFYQTLPTAAEKRRNILRFEIEDHHENGKTAQDDDDQQLGFSTVGSVPFNMTATMVQGGGEDGTPKSMTPLQVRPSSLRPIPLEIVVEQQSPPRISSPKTPPSLVPTTPANANNTPKNTRSRGGTGNEDGEEDLEEIVINVFDQEFVGLSEQAVDMNAKTQFQINHSIHICLLLIPGLNVIWIFFYILHCIGILQWF